MEEQNIKRAAYKFLKARTTDDLFGKYTLLWLYMKRAMYLMKI